MSGDPEKMETGSLVTSDNASHGSATIHREKNVEIEGEGNRSPCFLVSLNQANN